MSKNAIALTIILIFNPFLIHSSENPYAQPPNKCFSPKNNVDLSPQDRLELIFNSPDSFRGGITPVFLQKFIDDIPEINELRHNNVILTKRMLKRIFMIHHFANQEQESSLKLKINDQIAKILSDIKETEKNDFLFLLSKESSSGLSTNDFNYFFDSLLKSKPNKQLNLNELQLFIVTTIESNVYSTSRSVKTPNYVIKPINDYLIPFFVTQFKNLSCDEKLNLLNNVSIELQSSAMNTKALIISPHDINEYLTLGKTPKITLVYESFFKKEGNEELNTDFLHLIFALKNEISRSALPRKINDYNDFIKKHSNPENSNHPKPITLTPYLCMVISLTINTVTGKITLKYIDEPSEEIPKIIIYDLKPLFSKVL